MKKTFLAGLALLLPLAITLAVIAFILDLLTNPFLNLAEESLVKLNIGKELLVFISRLLILSALVVFTFFLGLIGKWIAFHWIDGLFSKIPLIKTVYQATSQLSKNFLKESATYFDKRLLVKYPSDSSLALGLQSSCPPPKVFATLPQDDYRAVFVPTSPHPVSGFLMLMHTSDIKEIDLTTEELFTILISCGVYDPSK